MLSNSEIKRRARAALNGHWGLAIGGWLLTMGINLMGSIITIYVFPGTGTINIILENIFSFIISVVIGIFTAGYCYMLLRLSREGQAAIGDVLYFFGHNPDRVMISGSVLGIIGIISNIPVFYINYGYHFDETSQQAWTTYYVCLLIAVAASMILNLLLTLPFVCTDYCLSDREDLGGIDGLKESAALMKGNWGRYILLEISFIGWAIGCIFTMYIGFLWLLPYMEMSTAEFFRALSEKNSQAYADWIE